MHTEKQAAETWCPMVRHASDDGDMASINRYGHDDESDSPEFARCIAGRCAMWRWTGSAPWPKFNHCAPEHWGAQEEPERPASIPSDWVFCPDDGDGAGWREPDEAAVQRRTGYCGIAGKPEFA